MILERWFQTGLCLLGALGEVVLGVLCLHGEGCAVQAVLRAVVDWKKGDVEETSKEMMADLMTDSLRRTKTLQFNTLSHASSVRACL